MRSPKHFLLHAGFLGIAVFLGLFAINNALSRDTANPLPATSALKSFVLDADSKFYDAKLTETNAAFVFSVTNTWTNEITVDRIQTSCGCTVASMPSNPWHIAAGAHGDVSATVNLEGKGSGLLQKTLTFYLSANGEYVGTKVAMVKVNIPKPPGPTALTLDERKVAMEKAKADPQKIFKDPKCAECHVKQGQHLLGEPLYVADCGICHDSPNRESSVPDLHALKVQTDIAYWKSILKNGKPGTMMPAFAATAGGPLDDDQVHSLLEYLNRFVHSHKGDNDAPAAGQ